MYNKPVCDCGKELVIYREDVAIVETTIKTNGLPYKKSDVTLGRTIYGDRLTCNNCHNEYELLKDKQGRIIRGKKH